MQSPPTQSPPASGAAPASRPPPSRAGSGIASPAASRCPASMRVTPASSAAEMHTLRPAGESATQSAETPQASASAQGERQSPASQTAPSSHCASEPQLGSSGRVQEPTLIPGARRQIVPTGLHSLVLRHSGRQRLSLHKRGETHSESSAQRLPTSTRGLQASRQTSAEVARAASRTARAWHLWFLGASAQWPTHPLRRRLRVSALPCPPFTAWEIWFT